MLRALAQESRIILENIGALGFNYKVCSFCDNGDQHALFDCRMLWAQLANGDQHDNGDQLAIKGFTPLVLALLAVAEPSLGFIQKGTLVIPYIQDFNPLNLPKPI